MRWRIAVGPVGLTNTDGVSPVLGRKVRALRSRADDPTCRCRTGATTMPGRLGGETLGRSLPLGVRRYRCRIDSTTEATACLGVYRSDVLAIGCLSTHERRSHDRVALPLHARGRSQSSGCYRCSDHGEPGQFASPARGPVYSTACRAIESYGTHSGLFPHDGSSRGASRYSGRYCMTGER